MRTVSPIFRTTRSRVLRDRPRQLLGSTMVVAAAGIMAACAAPTPTNELREARRAYQEAAAGPAPHYAPAKLVNAQKQLERAEEAHAKDPQSQEERHRAYLAERTARLADAHGQLAKGKADERQAQQQYLRSQGQALSASEQDLQQARTELDQERSARQEAEQRANEALDRLQKVASVQREQHQVRITLSGSVLFASGQASLLPTARENLRQVADALKSQPEGSRVVVEGHTDTQGSADFNRELSLRRAQSVKSFLEAEGVDPKRLNAVGKGQENPIATNATAEGRANNRRVEIVIRNGQRAQVGQSG